MADSVGADIGARVDNMTVPQLGQLCAANPQCQGFATNG
jgi:hypothetical protein